MSITIQAIAELAYNQLTGGGSDESTITLEELIEGAKLEYAYQSLVMAWQIRRELGEMYIDGSLLEEKELDVVDNEIDISELKILRILPGDVWLQDVGGVSCTCKYVKSTVNLTKVLCDDDSLGDNAKTFYIVGNKIKFPQGTHAKKLPIIYSNDGTGLEDNTVINEAVGAIVRTRLIDIYTGKTLPADTTNNSSPNN